MAFIQRLIAAETNREKWSAAFLLMALSFAAGLPGINRLDIHHDNEAYYILGAQEMIEGGHYLCPLYMERVHLDKPPPHYWGGVGGFQVLGMSLFAARLPALIAGMMLVGVTYFFALWAFNSGRAACFAALVLMSTFAVYRYSRLSLTDIAMTVGTTIGMLGFSKAVIEDKNKLLNTFVGSVGIGIAGFFKGHVGVIVGAFPCLIFFALALWKTRRLPWLHLMSPVAWLPALILSGWWYLYLFTSHESLSEISPSVYHGSTQTLSEFARNFFTQEVEIRSSGGVGRLLKNVPKYVGYLLLDYGPWSWCVLLGLFTGQRHLRDALTREPLKALTIVSMFIGMIVLFVVIIRSRNNARYLLPMSPALAALAGCFLDRWCGERTSRRRLLVPTLVPFFLVVACNVGFTTAASLRGRPLEQICETLEPRLRPQDTIYFHDFDRPIAFLKKHTFAMLLLNHRTLTLRGRLGDSFNRLMSNTPPIGTLYLITAARHLETVPPDFRSRFEVVSKAPLYAKIRNTEALRDRWNGKAEAYWILLKYRNRHP